MKKISRKLFNDNLSDTRAIKALALLIFVKTKFKASVVPDFSYYKLSKITGMHIDTVKKRIESLREMNLVAKEGKYGQHLRFNKVRAKKSNINFSRINKKSVKSIETGLRAMFVQEKICQKNYVKQLMESGDNPKTLKEKKKADEIIAKRGYTGFVDNGISYRYMAKKMKVGLNKVSEIIKYAETNKIVLKHKHIELYARIEGNAKNIVSMLGEENMFATKNNVYRVGCNTYSLHPKCACILR